MGRVNVNWITGVYSGRACRHDNIYTKVDRKTGACYSVALCNPNTNWNEVQLQQRANFGAISSDSNPFLIEQTASFGNRDAIEHKRNDTHSVFRIANQSQARDKRQLLTSISEP